MSNKRIRLTESQLNKIINNVVRESISQKKRQLEESKIDYLIESVVRRCINEEIYNTPGSLSYMSKNMISDEARELTQLGSLNNVKNYIKNEVEKLKGTKKPDKQRFLFGNGEGKYPNGIMGIYKFNDILFILTDVALGGDGYGLIKNGIAKRRY